MLQRIMLFMLLTLLALPALAHAEARELADRAWTDPKFGLSLNPPVGSRMIKQTHDDYLVRFIDGQQKFQLTAIMKRSRQQIGLMDVAEAYYLETASQFTLLQRERVEVEAGRELKQSEVGGKPATIAYLSPTTREGTKALIAQAVVLVDPFTFAVIEMRGAAADEAVIKSTFQAVLKTVAFAEQVELARQRKAAIEATLGWRQRLTKEDFQKLFGKTAFYRIVEGEQQTDIGWMMIEIGKGQFAGEQGARVQVKTHLELDNNTIDTLADYFRPYDGFQGEAWSIKTTLRSQGAPQGQNIVRSAQETGTTSRETLDVIIDGVAGVKARNLRFMKPQSPQLEQIRRQLAELRTRDTPQARKQIDELVARSLELKDGLWAYLPQADAWLIGHLLPHDVPATYGFYWFSNGEETITYRTERVTPTLGGFTLHTRLTAGSDELVSTFDSHGNLLSKDLGDGRRMIRSDLRSLQTLWKMR